MISPDERQTIISTYQKVLGVDKLEDVAEIVEFWNVLEPEAIVEKFAYKKANKIG